MDLEDILTQLLSDGLASKPREPEMSPQQALALVCDPSTDAKTVSRIFSRFDSDEIAEAVARHPNVSSYDLGILNVFMPEVAQSNPKFDQISADDHWQRNQAYYKSRRTKGHAQSHGTKVKWRTPQPYRVRYYLDNGNAEDVRYVLSLEHVPIDVLRPYLKSKRSHVRKLIAARPSLEHEDFERLAKDTAKSVRLALAANPSLPAQLAEALADDADADVRSAAAAHPSCPREAVHAVRLSEAAQPTAHSKAAESLSTEDVAELLRDPATSAARLDEIAAGAIPHIRYGCALHPNASRALLEAVATDAEPWLREAVAFNPAAPADVLESLAVKPSQALQRALAANPTTPKAVQLRLAEEAPGPVRFVLANTSDDPDVLSRLCQPVEGEACEKWQEHLAVALDPDAKPSKLRQLQRSRVARHSFTARLVARHPNCPPSLVAQYGYYCYSDLARNPSFALQVLENPDTIPRQPIKAWVISEWVAEGNIPGHVADHYLVSGDALEVRRGAGSRHASIRLLQPLVFHGDPRVRNELASRRDLTRFMIEALARDRNNKTRELLARNERCPRELLTMLAEDRTGAVRAAAMANRRYAPTKEKVGQGPATLRNAGPKKDRVKMAEEARRGEVLADLAGDRVVEVRRAVADNDHTTPEVLLGLLGDDDSRVRRLAVRSDLPRETLRALLDDADEDVRRRAYSALHYALQSKTHRSERDELLARAACDDSAPVRAFAARWTRDPALQATLAADGDRSVLRALAGNDRLAAELRAGLGAR